jgi:hypothetical protein
VRMGLHGGVAEYFEIQPDEPLPTTLDYLVAAIGGCMTRTAAGVLDAVVLTPTRIIFMWKQNDASRKSMGKCF